MGSCVSAASVVPAPYHHAHVVTTAWQLQGGMTFSGCAVLGSCTLTTSSSLSVISEHDSESCGDSDLRCKTVSRPGQRSNSAVRTRDVMLAYWPRLLRR